MKDSQPTSISVYFDLQQVHPLPKVQIQEAYYSRQLGYYSLCFVNIDAKSPTFYTWIENECGRDANAKGTALYNHLQSWLNELNTAFYRL